MTTGSQLSSCTLTERLLGCQENNNLSNKLTSCEHNTKQTVNDNRVCVCLAYNLQGFLVKLWRHQLSVSPARETREYFVRSYRRWIDIFLVITCYSLALPSRQSLWCLLSLLSASYVLFTPVLFRSNFWAFTFFISQRPKLCPLFIIFEWSSFPSYYFTYCDLRCALKCWERLLLKTKIVNS